MPDKTAPTPTLQDIRAVAAPAHTFGPQCPQCEGWCLKSALPIQPMPQAGAALTLTIGQHVRHRDYKGRRVTGTVRSLCIEDGALMATIGLDEPIVLEAIGPDERQINIYSQHVPAIELSPFDARDELIAEMLAALKALVEYHDDVPKAADQRLLDAAYAAMANATGGAA